ncbi:MAG: nicotinamide-nucleotide amidohydrolase family protein [Streptosporangiales bacterium]|nr:nicotinamide-nucleotide amidohydrolase family protein [Streptosporangiales bacterium]
MPQHDLAARVLTALEARGETLAVAESLTGGLLGATITSVPGASSVFRGGVIAYATDVKASLLGVDPDLLAREGAVHPEVARQLAAGVRARLSATYGLGLTGVAGPDPQDGRPPGTLYVGVAGPDGAEAVAPRVGGGDRPSIRSEAVAAALDLLATRLGAFR